MDVRNCRKCGTVFNYVAGPPICQACKEALEAKFQEVKAYIYDNPNVTIPQISEACEVEKSLIHQWIREERLVFSDDSPIGINCENCGANIKTGRLCDKCKAQLIGGLKNAARGPQKPLQPQKKTKDNPRMRFLDS